MSHERRQPLSAVLAAFSLWEANPGAETAARPRRVMQRQLLQMSRLLDDLLDMSRLTVQSLELKLIELDLRPVVEAAVETVCGRAAERRQQLDVRLPAVD